MAGEKAAETSALKTRETVELSDGKKVTVERWSLAKMQALIFKAAGSFEHMPEVAIESTRPEDRPTVQAIIDADDRESLILIVAVVMELNVTPGVLKNLPRLVQARMPLVQAINAAAKEK